MILPLIAYAVGVGLVLAAMGATVERVLALRRQPRRWVWAAAIGANLLMAVVVPWRSAGPSSAASTTGWIASATGRMMGADAYRSAAFAGPHWPNRMRRGVDEIERASAGLDPIAGWAWAVGSIAVTVFYAASLLVLARRRRSWRETWFRGTRILVASKDGPAVVGIWNPHIVVPEWTLGLEPRTIDLLLDHEREHQRARDPLLLHAAAIAVMVMPWNPAAWWMLARVRLAVEMDCDARVLGQDVAAGDASAYGELLLTVAIRQSPTQSAVAPAMLEHPSMLRKRIAAMYPNRVGLTGPRIATASGTALALLTIALLVPVPRLRAQPVAQDASAAKPPAAPGPPAQVYEIGNGVRSPVPIRQQDPTYTRAAMQAKVQGEVLLSGVVEANGVLDQIQVTKSLDTVYGLDQAAIDAATKWLFTPGMKDGKAVPVHVQLVLEFRLQANPPRTRTPQSDLPAATQAADDDFAKGAYTDSTPGLVLPKPTSLRPDPTYSREAMQEQIQGTVKVEAVVAADGTVDRVRVVESLDKVYGLDEAALAAAKRWTFEPGTLNGQPVPVLVNMTMEFRLR